MRQNQNVFITQVRNRPLKPSVTVYIAVWLNVPYNSYNKQQPGYMQLVFQIEGNCVLWDTNWIHDAG